MKTTHLYFEGGIVRCVSTDTAAVIIPQLGLETKRRASHVWPVHPVKQRAFRLLRRIFGESGRIAAWCRSWRGPWEVRFVDPLNPRRIGAVVYSHPSRRVCIDWEVKQLNNRLSK